LLNFGGFMKVILFILISMWSLASSAGMRCDGLGIDAYIQFYGETPTGEYEVFSGDLYFSIEDHPLKNCSILNSGLHEIIKDRAFSFTRVFSIQETCHIGRVPIKVDFEVSDFPRIGRQKDYQGSITVDEKFYSISCKIY
jgi:hypothetical protein